MWLSVSSSNTGWGCGWHFSALRRWPAGASFGWSSSCRWQLCWRISWPQLIPVTSTLILIRMIEAFKIIDLPNVLTNGGPGTATESLTLHAFMAWRTLDIGGSAAVAYMLLFVVTFAALSYVNLAHRRLAETA